MTVRVTLAISLAMVLASVVHLLDELLTVSLPTQRYCTLVVSVVMRAPSSR